MSFVLCMMGLLSMLLTPTMLKACHASVLVMPSSNISIC